MPALDNIDDGKPFDWGLTSQDYGKYRDIYPSSYFQNLRELGIHSSGVSLLDIGTGTGVLPRGLYQAGMRVSGIDISAEQITVAQKLASDHDQNIYYTVATAENTGFNPASFKFITAAQCLIYFDLPVAMKEIDRILKHDGRFIVTWFSWLPKKSEIAKRTEELVLSVNPQWKGANYEGTFGEPDMLLPFGFKLDKEISYEEDIPFNYESWTGRIRACRGIGATLSSEEVKTFDAKHLALLQTTASEHFSIPHHVLIRSYGRKEEIPER